MSAGGLERTVEKARAEGTLLDYAPHADRAPSGMPIKTAVADQEPGEREPLGVGEHRLDRDKGS